MPKTRNQPVLAVDIGAGTQDVFIYEPDKPIENCVQLVLPSPTVIVAADIERATKARQAIALTGRLMGGGPCVQAVKRHLRAGLPVYAEPEPAATINDDLNRVAGMGVKVVDTCPDDALKIQMSDIHLNRLEETLALYGVSMPGTIAFAVQDHGFSPDKSNRRSRFEFWRNYIESDGSLDGLLYGSIPPLFTRMMAVRGSAPQAWVMDTAVAAIRGALLDPEVEKHRPAGLVVINMGNGHTLGALVRGDRIWGLLEDHTGSLGPGRLRSYVDRLRAGSLTNDEVFSHGGHGSHIHRDYTPGFLGGFVAVTGPNRQLAQGLGYHLASPFGNMMLSGSFGLASAVLHQTTGKEQMR